MFHYRTRLIAGVIVVVGLLVGGSVSYGQSDTDFKDR
jgi:hypothetical protein